MRETSKLCPVCGAPNIISARFCVSCGQALGTATTETKAYSSLTNFIETQQMLVNVSSDTLIAPQKPSRLQKLSFLYLIDSVINISLGLLWLSLICTAPLGIYSIVVGIFEFLYALRILPDPIKPDQTDMLTMTLIQTSKPNRGLAIMQIINILSLNIFSLIVGVLSLSWMKEKAIKDYLAEINARPPRIPMETPDQLKIYSLHNYERLSGIFWIVLGTFQCLTILGLIAGLWNIFAGISSCKMSSRILRRDKRVPKEYEDITSLIIIGVVNLIFGGVIGLLFVAFDFHIRDRVLKNRHLFYIDM